MKQGLVLLLVGLSCCTSLPKNFTYNYSESDIDLSTRINIEGYYVAQHGCDSTFFSMFMFYPNGVFTIATTSEITDELISCFENGEASTVCKYPLWGSYRLTGDTIRTQTIRPEGGGCVIFRDYIITSEKELINVSDYVDIKYTKLGYMENYPSFKENRCAVLSQFFPLQTKKDIEKCHFFSTIRKKKR